MGPLFPVYVALSALNFQLVTACQDGKLALFFFCFIIIFLAFIAFSRLLSFLALTLLLA